MLTWERSDSSPGQRPFWDVPDNATMEMGGLWLGGGRTTSAPCGDQTSCLATEGGVPSWGSGGRGEAVQHRWLQDTESLVLALDAPSCVPVP